MTPMRPVTVCSEERGCGGQPWEYREGLPGGAVFQKLLRLGAVGKRLLAKEVNVKARRGERPWPLNSLSQPLGHSPSFLGHSHSLSTTLPILGDFLDRLSSHSPALYPLHTLEQGSANFSRTEPRRTYFRLGGSYGFCNEYSALLPRQKQTQTTHPRMRVWSVFHATRTFPSSVQTPRGALQNELHSDTSTWREHRIPQVRGSVPQARPTSDASHLCK